MPPESKVIFSSQLPPGNLRQIVEEDFLVFFRENFVRVNVFQLICLNLIPLILVIEASREDVHHGICILSSQGIKFGSGSRDKEYQVNQETKQGVRDEVMNSNVSLVGQRGIHDDRRTNLFHTRILVS